MNSVRPAAVRRLISQFVILGALSGGALLTGGCANSAQEQEAAEALKKLGALVVPNPLDGIPAQSVSLGTAGVKDKLDEAMPWVAHLRRMEALTLDGAPA